MAGSSGNRTSAEKRPCALALIFRRSKAGAKRHLAHAVLAIGTMTPTGPLWFDG